MITQYFEILGIIKVMNKAPLWGKKGYVIRRLIEKKTGTVLFFFGFNFIFPGDSSLLF